MPFVNMVCIKRRVIVGLKLSVEILKELKEICLLGLLSCKSVKKNTNKINVTFSFD